MLCEQLAAMGSTYGASRMRMLAPHVLDGSRSPAESCQSMLLNLPYMRGGFNLSVCDPVLNPPVALVGRSALTGKRHYVPDLLYPAQKVAVEYNGRQHFDPRAASRDEARRNDFLSMGYEVWTVTWEQLADDRAFCALARGISKRLGRRVRPATASFAERRLELRSQLFGRAC